ncbi:redox-sensing transcriptional repressor Rex [Chordicoccus furentiruminis]|uniref:redox-sensing transcriptional repressor Rex n=1 Tax=Chordicoccus furentiruminis TaxID=2709410 RepID=UPI0023A8A61C|nr:redox-sensing transcriptional repressor Rex [Chordicoccus furentiruminis]
MKRNAQEAKNTYLTKQALQRMPYYLQYLKGAKAEGKSHVSAAAIAEELELSDVLVRKDIAAVSSKQGRPKAGFEVDTLIEDIELYMGYHHTKEAVLVGAGSLGRALLGNREFGAYGFQIVAAFDVRRSVIRKTISGVEVLSLAKLRDYCLRRNIQIGIITVPAEAAQDVADRMVDGGIRAIWNFALVKLKVPEGVLVQNEDLASSLAMLSQHLRLGNEMDSSSGWME